MSSIFLRTFFSLEEPGCFSLVEFDWLRSFELFSDWINSTAVLSNWFELEVVLSVLLAVIGPDFVAADMIGWRKLLDKVDPDASCKLVIAAETAFWKYFSFPTVLVCWENSA